MNKSGLRIYVIADTHFGHKNIISYEGRPFTSTQEMNAALVRNWNSVVGPEDIVIHLGDVALASRSRIREIVAQLNGRKSLIVGNHDRKLSDGFWVNAGFAEVFREPLQYGNLILSHEPLMGLAVVNVHGHVHSQTQGLDPSTHQCVSVEVTGYKPILLRDVVAPKYSDISGGFAAG